MAAQHISNCTITTTHENKFINTYKNCVLLGLNKKAPGLEITYDVRLLLPVQVCVSGCLPLCVSFVVRLFFVCVSVSIYTHTSACKLSVYVLPNSNIYLCTHKHKTNHKWNRPMKTDSVMLSTEHHPRQCTCLWCTLCLIKLLTFDNFLMHGAKTIALHELCEKRATV